MGKERPIPFNGPMVQAILAGQKTQTRRLVNVTSNDGRHTIGDDWRFTSGRDSFCGQNDYEKGEWCWQHRTDIRRVLVERCPFGQVGDRLWVRESARLVATDSDLQLTTGIRADARVEVKYLADGALAWVPYPNRLATLGMGHCIANGCHREASRILLEVTELRVERLQDISDDDAKAEGFPLPPGPMRVNGKVGTGVFFDARRGLIATWDSLAPKGARWADSPWVWVVGFKRVEVSNA